MRLAKTREFRLAPRGLLGKKLMRTSFIVLVATIAVWLASSLSSSAQTATPEQCAEAWATTQQEDTLAAYQNFLSYFSNCPEAAAARERIETRPPSGDRGGEQGPSQPSQPPPGPAPSPGYEASVALPNFPWPPPRPTDQMLLPRNRLLIALEDNPSLYDLGDHLSRGLDRAGYVERSFYAVPHGFALVARLERILDNGQPAPNAYRYMPPGAEPFSLTAYLSGLFVAPVGRYRQIVFVVTDRAFAATGDELTQREAADLLREGANRLPSYFRTMPYSEDYDVTALIYEFEKTGTVGQMRQLESGRLGARTHLNRAGIYARVVP